MAAAQEQLGVQRQVAPSVMAKGADEEMCYEYIARFRDNERTQELLQWVNGRLAPYRLSAENFTSSFQNPKVFCGLLKSFEPAAVDLGTCEEHPIVSVDLAMTIAEEKLGVARAMGPNVMLDSPDADAVFSYVAQLQQADRERTLLKWVNREHLSQVGNVTATDFGDGFKDARVLTGLTESFVPGTVSIANMSGDSVSDIGAAMAVSTRELGLKPTVTAKEMSANTSGRAQASNFAFVAQFKEQESKAKLLAWLNGQIKPFGVLAADFSESFRDPKVVCALAKTFDSKAIELSAVSAATGERDVKAAFAVGAALSVTPTTTAADLLAGANANAVAQYVASYREQARRQELQRWVNGKLRPFKLECSSFSADFKNPAMLCSLVEALAPGLSSVDLNNVSAETARTDVSKAQAVVEAAFGIAPKLTSTDIVTGRQEPRLVEYLEALRAFEKQGPLLDWVNAKVAPFNVEVDNFSESFCSGKVLGALIKSFVPSSADPAAMGPATALADVLTAMATGFAKLGVPTPEGLSPEGMVSGAAEEVVMAYMDAFRSKEREGELLEWLNSQIGAYEVHAENFNESFSNPEVLCALVKAFEPKAVDLSTATADNAEAAVNAAMAVAEEKLGVVSVADASALLDGGEEAIQFVEKVREEARKKALLEWLNTKLRSFGVSAANFSEDFRDPKVVCGLVKAFEPKEVNLDNVTASSAVRELGKALEVAEETLGVAQTLEPKQLLDGADSSAVVDYVADIREAERRKELLAWLNGRLGPYELEAKDFDASFKDPKIFSGLVKSFAPEDPSLDLKTVRAATAVTNIEKALGVAEQLGVARRTTAQAMVNEPDADTIQRTVADFRELARRADLLEWVNHHLASQQLNAEESDVLKAEDFDVSWRDPQVVGGLVSALDAQVNLDIAGLSQVSAAEGIEEVLVAAEESLDVQRTISATQMAEGASAPAKQQLHESNIVQYVEGLREAARERQLLMWLNGRIEEFECVAEDFGESFKNPKVVCALVKSFVSKETDLTHTTPSKRDFKSDEIDLTRITPATAEKELDAVFGVGERKCKVAPTTTASAMLTTPDARAAKQYVAAFHDYERKQQLLEWLNAKIRPAELATVKNLDEDMKDGKV
jgi:hypothetical protein